jgi:NADH-quinone oxidoreductase subunit A
MTALLGYMALFLVIAVAFVLVHLLIGKLIRPAKPSAEKMTIYECGEPTIGSAWIQFDLRFYVIALLFVVFDVEVAFFFPWAVVFGQANNVHNSYLPIEQQAQAYLDLTPDSPATHAQRQRIQRLIKQATPAAQGSLDQELPSADAVAATQLTVPEAREALEQELAAVRGPAKSLAWLAFWDILVFFGVLLVGYAYLWRRGDLVWVRSTAAEQVSAAPPPRPAPPAPALAPAATEQTLVAAGH